MRFSGREAHVGEIKMQTEFSWFRIGASGRNLVNTVKNYRVPLKAGNLLTK